MDPPQTRGDGGRLFGWPILFAPLIFIAHFLEEGTSFVVWFNAHVPNGITESLFWNVNVTALARSEERRVEKECRSRWWPSPTTQQTQARRYRPCHRPDARR